MIENQILITITITTTTLLTLISGLQLIFLIKEIRKKIKNADIKIETKEKNQEKTKKLSFIKKKPDIYSIINKISIISQRKILKKYNKQKIS